MGVETILLADPLGQSIEEFPWDPGKKVPDYFMRRIGKHRIMFRLALINNGWAGYRQCTSTTESTESSND